MLNYQVFPFQTEKLIESESQLSTTLSKLQDSNEALQRKSAEADQLKTVLNEAKQNLEAAQSENSNLVTKEQQLSQSLQVSNLEIGRFKEGKNGLEAQLGEVKSQCKIQQEECSRLKSEKASITEKCTKIEKEAEEAKKALKALNLSHNTSLKELEDSKGHAKSLQDDLTATRYAQMKFLLCGRSHFSRLDLTYFMGLRVFPGCL